MAALHHILFLLVLQFICFLRLPHSTKDGYLQRSTFKIMIETSRPAAGIGVIEVVVISFRSAAGTSSQDPPIGARPVFFASELSLSTWSGQIVMMYLSTVARHGCLGIWEEMSQDRKIYPQTMANTKDNNFQLFAPLIWKQNERENVWEYRLEAKPSQNQDRLLDKFAWSPFSRVSRAVWLSTCRVQRPVKNIFLPVINEADVASSQKQPARPTIYSLPHNKNRRLYQ